MFLKLPPTRRGRFNQVPETFRLPLSSCLWDADNVRRKRWRNSGRAVGYSEVVQIRASRKLGLLVTISRLLGSQMVVTARLISTGMGFDRLSQKNRALS